MLALLTRQLIQTLVCNTVICRPQPAEPGFRIEIKLQYMQAHYEIAITTVDSDTRGTELGAGARGLNGHIVIGTSKTEFCRDQF
jgi:hypothetical protein